MSKSKLRQSQIKQLLSKNFPIKVILSFISTVNTFKQKMVEFGKENEKLISKINRIIVIIFPILPLLGVNRYLTLLNMYNQFFYSHNKEERINKFTIGCTVNSTLHVSKSFKYQA